MCYGLVWQRIKSTRDCAKRRVAHVPIESIVSMEMDMVDKTDALKFRRRQSQVSAVDVFLLSACIVPGSSPAEILFSISSHVDSCRRGCLTSKDLKKLVSCCQMQQKSSILFRKRQLLSVFVGFRIYYAFYTVSSGSCAFSW